MPTPPRACRWSCWPGASTGPGSSRDWAAKGTALLGVRAVLAESYERIHRSNLIGMGVLPLQFYKGDSAAEPRADRARALLHRRARGAERRRAPEGAHGHRARPTTARSTEFRAVVRIDTPMEAEYYRHGGILHYVLRQMAG